MIERDSPPDADELARIFEQMAVEVRAGRAVPSFRVVTREPSWLSAAAAIGAIGWIATLVLTAPIPDAPAWANLATIFIRAAMFGAVGARLWQRREGWL